MNCSLLDRFKDDELFRRYFLTCIKRPDKESFYGTGISDVMKLFSANHEPLGILPARYGIGTKTFLPHHISTLAVLSLYLKRHPKENRVPKMVLESVIANQFKPNRTKVYSVFRTSSTFKSIEKNGNPALFEYDRLWDFTGCRRAVFAAVLSEKLQPKDSLEYTVLDRFLREQGLMEQGETIFNKLQTIQENGFTLESNSKISYFPNYLRRYSEIFCYSKVSSTSDTNDFYAEFAQICYEHLVNYINSTKLDFLAELRVMDVLHAIMTIGATGTPINALPDFIEDEEKRKSLTEMISCFFMGGLPIELGRKCIIETYEDVVSSKDEEQIVSASKMVSKLAKKSDVRENIDTIHNIINEHRQKALGLLLEADYYCVSHIGNYSHRLHVSRGIVPLVHLHSRNHATAYIAKLGEDDNELYNIVDYTHTMQDISKRASNGFDAFMQNHAKFETLLSVFKFGVASGRFKIEPNTIQKFSDDFDGNLAETITQILSVENYFDDSVTFDIGHLSTMIRTLEQCHRELDETDELEVTSPDDIFKEMERIRKADVFDAEKFTSISLRYAEAMSGVSEIEKQRKLVFDSMLERLGEYVPKQKPTEEAKPEEPETSTLNMTEEFQAVQNDLDEAMELLHAAETERDTFKSELQTTKVQLEEAQKRAYSLERPAVCGAALIKMAKKGYIDSVEHALAVAEGLSEGKLRVLPSAWESAQNSRYNLPDKIKNALCLLADRYLEDLKVGGVAEAKKAHGRSFKSKESKTVMQCDKFREQRTFEVDGEKRVFETHLSFGIKSAKDNHIRIYFDADMENEQVIIAYCGRHLDTVSTS